MLRDLHDEFDRLVIEAYGWDGRLTDQEILTKLVDLHDERRAEEESGQVRWLRPEFQKERFALEALVILGKARQSDNDRYHPVEVPAVM